MYLELVQVWSLISWHTDTPYICVCESVKVLFAQSCLTLCSPIEYSLLGSYVHGILQTRILDWVAIPCSRGSSRLRDQTRVSCITGRFFIIWGSREAIYVCVAYIYDNPLQYSCLGNPKNRGAWQATVHTVAKSWTWLKRLSTEQNTHTHTHTYIYTSPRINVDTYQHQSPGTLLLTFPFWFWNPVTDWDLNPWSFNWDHTPGLRT